MRERAALEQELRHLRTPPGSGSFEREILHTPDQRTQVHNTEAAPFRFICHLDLTATDNTNAAARARSTATGILVGPRHVLIAGHTARSSNGRFTATHAWVTPGRNAGTRPFGRVEGKSFRHHPRWFRNGVANDDYDYGLLILDSAIGSQKFRSLGNARLGWWGDPANGAGTSITRLDPATLDGSAIRVAGYPSDKTAGECWESAGQVTMMRTPQGQIDGTARRFAHDADTHGSQSGAPVWIHNAKTGASQLVGVHTGAINVTAGSGATARTQRLNVAIRVTREFLRQLAAWT
jgi:V8-like Glu-specific endopeptidase